MIGKKKFQQEHFGKQEDNLDFIYKIYLYGIKFFVNI